MASSVLCTDGSALQVGHDGWDGLECSRPGDWGGSCDWASENLRWVVRGEVVWRDTSCLAGEEGCLNTSRTALALSNLVVVGCGRQEVVVVEPFDSAGCDSHCRDASRAGRGGTSIGHLLEVGGNDIDGRTIVTRSVECADLSSERDTDALGSVNDAGIHAFGLRRALKRFGVTVGVRSDRSSERLSNVGVVDLGEGSLVIAWVDFAHWLLIVLLPSLLVVVLQKLEEL